MIARFFELVGGVLVAVGLGLGLFLRFHTRAQYLPETIANFEVAMGIAVFGGVFILASKIAQGRFPRR